MGVSAVVAVGAMAAYSYDQAERSEDKLYAQGQEQKKKAEEAKTLLIEQQNLDKAQQDRATAASTQARKRVAGADGRASTIKTGPQGLGDVNPANAQSKTLLGY